MGMNRFVLRADPPVIETIPPEDLPLTIIALKGFDKGSSQTEQEFIRIGFYVQNKAPVDAVFCIEDPMVHQLLIQWDSKGGR
jgi:hypothetical protein